MRCRKSKLAERTGGFPTCNEIASPKTRNSKVDQGSSGKT